MSRAAAAAAIAALFADGGDAVLAATGLGSWRAVLAPVDEAALGRALGARLPGLAVLVAARAAHDTEVAWALTRGLVAWLSARLGEHHPDVLVEVAALGRLARRRGATSDGRQHLEAAWSGLAEAGRVGDAARVALHLAGARVEDGDADAAEHLLVRAWRDVRSHDTGLAAQLAARLGELRLGRGLDPEAVPMLEAAHADAVARFGAHDPRTLARARLLARAALGARRPEVARTLLAPLVARLDGEAAEALRPLLVRALVAEGRHPAAEREVGQAVAWGRAQGGAVLADRLVLAGQVAGVAGRAARAEAWLREAAEVASRVGGEAEGRAAAALGAWLDEAGRGDEALGWLEVAVARLRGTAEVRAPAARRFARLLATARGATGAERRELAASAAAMLGRELPHDHRGGREARRLAGT